MPLVWDISEKTINTKYYKMPPKLQTSNWGTLSFPCDHGRYLSSLLGKGLGGKNQLLLPNDLPTCRSRPHLLQWFPEACEHVGLL